MPLDQGFIGQNAHLKFGATELQPYYRSSEPKEEADLVEYSAGSDANKLYLVAQKDGTWDVEIVLPPGTLGTAIRAAVAIGAYGTIESGPEGTATGKPKKTVYAVVKSRGEPLSYNDLTTLSISFQFNGAVSDSAY